MATPSGTIFAEIGIDYSPATRAQQQLLKDATTTSLNIEQNFKNLGIKSSAEFDLMRQKIANSYEMISNSGKASATDIMRAEEAKNAKLTQLNEQQYGKQTSFIDSMKAQWVAASIAIVAAWMLVNKAISIGKEIASAANDIQRMSNMIGVSTDEWQKFSYAAKMSDVSNESLMRGMKALSASMEEFNNKSGDGYKILTALGLSTVDVTGKQKPLTQMFKEVATEFSKYEGGARMVDYANKLMGKSGMDLIPMFKDGGKGIDEYGDKLLRMGSIIGEVAIKAGSAAEDEFKNLDTRINSMKVNLAPLVLILGKGAENLASMVNWLTKPVEIPWWLGGGTLSFFTGLQSNPISALDKPLELAVSHGENYVSTLKKALPVLVDIKKATEDAEKAAKKAADEADKAYAKAFSEVTRQIKVEDEYYEQQIKNTIEIEKVEKKAAEEREKEIDGWVKREIEAYSQVDKENEKFIEDEIKREKDLKKEQVKFAADRLVVVRKMTEDIGKFTKNEYDLKKYLLDEQYRDYERFVKDKNLLDRWYDIRLIQLEEERALRSNDFFAGMKVQMDQNSREQVAWGQVGADVFTKFTQDAQKQLSDNLFNVLTGKFDELGVNWNALWEGMLRTLTDKLAQMAIEAAAAQVWKLLAPAVGSGIDWLGSIFAAKGIWDVKGAAGGIPVIAHPGEMIVPADLASQIREAGGGGAQFDTLQSLMEGMKGTQGANIPGLNAFLEGTLQQHGKLAAIGTLMTATGKISIDQLMQGLFSPQAMVSSMIMGGLPAAMSEIFGLDKVGDETKLGKTSKAFSRAMTVGTLLGGPLAGIMSGLAAQFLSKPIAKQLYNWGVVPYDWLYYAPYEPGPNLQWPDYAPYEAGPYSPGMEGGPSGGGGAEGGASEGGGAGQGGGGASEGFRRGGIARGPESGYWARLHGTEQITPLKSGNAPIGGRTININSPLIKVEGGLIADGQTLNDFVEKLDYMLDKMNKRVYRA